ncbi:MAG TPA: isoprenylcysteine carboxylmethyltransferase family protein [Rhizomicrobium sp.]|nr:isoprenylcysteine carboxylmethyltransferase family protein [Rhizomicrobium sp.]
MEAKLTAAMVVRSAVWIALMGAALFLGAGDWTWPQGWAFVVLFALMSLGFGVWLGRRDPALLASRLKLVQEGTAWWDRIFLALFIAAWFGWLVAMGMDARRYHWSSVPSWVGPLGALLVIAGFLATMRVFAENSFAAPVVRLQAERGQRVIDTGPYALMRHPMYASALLYLIGIPLMLGSLWGLVYVPLVLIGLGPRAMAEERLLARALPGYADYMQRVRWRLIPYLW